jgi:hypothetical protein
MDSDGAVMWLAITQDGKRLSEKETLWPNIPPQTRIAELLYFRRLGGVRRLKDFDAYGFQRYVVTAPHGHVGAGVQLIGVKDKEAVIVECNEVDGTSREWTVPASDLTYNPELLRHGME